MTFKLNCKFLGKVLICSSLLVEFVTSLKCLSCYGCAEQIVNFSRFGSEPCNRRCFVRQTPSREISRGCDIGFWFPPEEFIPDNGCVRRVNGDIWCWCTDADNCNFKSGSSLFEPTQSNTSGFTFIGNLVNMPSAEFPSTTEIIFANTVSSGFTVEINATSCPFTMCLNDGVCIANLINAQLNLFCLCPAQYTGNCIF